MLTNKTVFRSLPLGEFGRAKLSSGAQQRNAMCFPCEVIVVLAEPVFKAAVIAVVKPSFNLANGASQYRTLVDLHVEVAHRSSPMRSDSPAPARKRARLRLASPCRRRRPRNQLPLLIQKPE